MIAVYRILNEVSGKFYVGSSINVEKRFLRHRKDLKSGRNSPWLQRAWDKHGEDSFIFEVIQECSTEEEARRLEQDILDELSDSGLLYNISSSATGGDLISRHPQKEEIVARRTKTLLSSLEQLTPEERAAKFGRSGSENGMFGKTHSAAAKESMREKYAEWLTSLDKHPLKDIPKSEDHRKIMAENARLRRGEKNPFFGKSHSEATRAHISEANRGRQPVNKRRLIVDGVEYESLAAAALALGVSASTVWWRATKGKSFDNYCWKEVEHDG